MNDNIEPRSIFANIKMILQSVANAIAGVTNVANTTSNMFNELADTGLVMATSNKTLVTMETMGKEEERKVELLKKYPKLKL